MSAIPKWFIRRLQILESLKFAPASMSLHWLALRDVNEADLQHAVERAARECDEFPSPKMLRVFITEKHAHAIAPQPEDRSTAATTPRAFTVPNVSTPVNITREWRYYCLVCNDSGWINHWCGSEAPQKPWLVRRTCERRGEHGSHEWVRLCPCVARNPDVPAHVKQHQQALAA